MDYTLLFWLLYALISVSATNEFVNPPAVGVDVALNAQVVVKWICDDCGSTNVTLNVFQNKGGGIWAKEVLLVGIVNPGSFIWTSHVLEDLSISAGFHFELQYKDTSFNSGALFIRDTLRSSSSTSISSSLSTTSISTTSTANAGTSSDTSSPTSISALPSSNPGGNNDDKVRRVGLGVGLGIGIPFLLLIGGCILYILLSKRRHQTTSDAAYESNVENDVSNGDAKARPIPEMRGDEWRHELTEERGVNELQA